MDKYQVKIAEFDNTYTDSESTFGSGFRILSVDSKNIGL